MNVPSDAWQAFFADDREWLERQPGMRPWAKGCCRLGATLEGWLDEYHQQLSGKPPPTEAAARAGYVRRLWACWSYHWQKAVDLHGKPVDGQGVAGDVRAGRDAAGGSLGGNPLPDVVLVAGVVRDEPEATARFVDGFRSLGMDTLAATLGRDVRDFPELWWDHLLAFVRPALATYRGRSTLAGWFWTITKNFARKQKGVLDGGRGPRPPEAPQSADPGRDPGRDEDSPSGPDPTCERRDSTPDLAGQQTQRNERRELLADLLPRALARLSPEDRTVLFLRYVERLSFWQIEQLVVPKPEGPPGKPGRNKRSRPPAGQRAKFPPDRKPGGTAHRWTKQALQALRKKLLEVGDQAGRGKAVREYLLSDPQDGTADDLWELLEDALRQTGQDARQVAQHQDDQKEDQR